MDTGETDPFDSDTDGDGIQDGAERQNGTDPLRGDTDEDGLIDGLEDRNGDGELGLGETDPLRADTDGDALIDGLEERNGDGIVGPRETDRGTRIPTVMASTMDTKTLIETDIMMKMRLIDAVTAWRWIGRFY